MRLSTLLGKNQSACWLLWDDLASMASVLQLDLSDPADQARLQRFISFALKVLSLHATGVILEPFLGLPELEAKAKGKGVALRWERTAVVEDSFGLPVAETDWDAAAIRENYAVAKVGMWYHPSEEQALAKKQLLAELADSCRYEGCDLVLHLRVPDLQAEGKEAAPEALLQAIQELRTYPQALIIDPLTDPLMAATLTAELDIPWVVALSNSEYSAVKEMARAHLDSGARGIAIGSGLWSDMVAKVSLDNEQAVLEWIATEARDRLIELKRIVDEQVTPVLHSS